MVSGDWFFLLDQIVSFYNVPVNISFLQKVFVIIGIGSIRSSIVFIEFHIAFIRPRITLLSKSITDLYLQHAPVYKVNTSIELIYGQMYAVTYFVELVFIGLKDYVDCIMIQFKLGRSSCEVVNDANKTFLSSLRGKYIFPKKK